jgi:hypothetical protein
VNIAPELTPLFGRKTLPLLLAGIAFVTARGPLLLFTLLIWLLLLTLRTILTISIARMSAPVTRIGLHQRRGQSEDERHQQRDFHHPVDQIHHSFQP